MLQLRHEHRRDGRIVKAARSVASPAAAVVAGAAAVARNRQRPAPPRGGIAALLLPLVVGSAARSARDAVAEGVVAAAALLLLVAGVHPPLEGGELLSLIGDERRQPHAVATDQASKRWRQSNNNLELSNQRCPTSLLAGVTLLLPRYAFYMYKQHYLVTVTFEWSFAHDRHL